MYNFNGNDTSSLSYLPLTITAMSDPLIIKATITNTHPTVTFSILDWETPLAEEAFSVGVFSINRLGDEDNTMLGWQARMSRMMPPPRSCLVEIAPGDSKTQEFDIPLDEFPLQSGQTYRIRAAGSYRAVWPFKIKKIKKSELMALGFGRRAICGTFKSNEAEFIAP